MSAALLDGGALLPPPPASAPPRGALSAFARVLWLWRGRAPSMLAGLVVALLSLAAAVSLLTLSGAWIGGIASGGAVLALVPLLRAAGISRVVLRYAERLVTHSATFRALADLRVWFFRGVARSGAGGLGARRAGDVLTRLVGDVDSLDGVYLRILVPLAGALLLLPALGVLIGRRDPVLAAWVCALFALCALLLPLLAATRAARAGTGLAAGMSALRVSALDALTGLREVRAFGAEGRMLAAVQAREAALLSAQRDLSRRSALVGAAAFLCAQAALLAVLLSATRGPHGGLGAAAVACAFLVVAAFEAVGGLPRAGVLAGHAAAGARRVLEAAEAPPAVPEPASPAAAPSRSGLRFEGIGFRWQPDRPPVLDGLTLDVPEGARVAVMGPSGAGKSTLAALALRVAAPQAGRVSLGGVDLATLSSESLRARIAWLGQRTHLFADTVRANLLLGRPDASDAELWEALERAAVAPVVRALPGGLDAWLGEGGAGVSGGEGRRIALARVLLQRAPVLILDEPCAGLDAETERAFLLTLNETTAGRTVVLITHRLTGVERLDRIWRLSGGRAIAAAA